MSTDSLVPKNRFQSIATRGMTPAPVMPVSPFQDDPLLKPFRCRLSSCKKDVGLTDGVRLYVAGMVIAHRVSFTCAHCGYESVWRPVLKPIAPR